MLALRLWRGCAELVPRGWIADCEDCSHEQAKRNPARWLRCFWFQLLGSFTLEKLERLIIPLKGFPPWHFQTVPFHFKPPRPLDEWVGWVGCIRRNVYLHTENVANETNETRYWNSHAAHRPPIPVPEMELKARRGTENSRSEGTPLLMRDLHIYYTYITVICKYIIYHYINILYCYKYRCI